MRVTLYQGCKEHRRKHRTIDVCVLNEEDHVRPWRVSSMSIAGQIREYKPGGMPSGPSGDRGEGWVGWGKGQQVCHTLDRTSLLVRRSLCNSRTPVAARVCLV